MIFTVLFLKVPDLKWQYLTAIESIVFQPLTISWMAK